MKHEQHYFKHCYTHKPFKAVAPKLFSFNFNSLPVTEMRNAIFLRVCYPDLYDTIKVMCFLELKSVAACHVFIDFP